MYLIVKFTDIFWYLREANYLAERSRLVLGLYKIYILIHFKNIDINTAIFSKYHIDIVSKLKS